jgi:hypothetical protein
MENTKTVFLSTVESDVPYELQCFVNTNNDIYISISDPANENDICYICFNKQTAIKFSKHLRKQISILMETEGGDNG